MKGKMKRTFRYVALTAAGLLAAATAAAQDAAIEEIVVTGSYIAGTPEDAATPVETYTAEDLANTGSPTALTFIKNLSVSSGVIGDTNQFDSRAQASEGAGTVNLRGLGAPRTLVLMNGRRMVNNPRTGAPDTNMIPTAALGRIEVLKDGAAALYGSDAIGGVVNFITRSDLEGFELGGDYGAVDGSAGDYNLKAAYGWAGEASNLLVTVGANHRARLRVTDRDWAALPFEVAPASGWSGGGHPAGFISLAAGPANLAGHFADPGCSDVGGTPLPSGGGATIPRCRLQYTLFDNLVEEQDRYQVYAEFNRELANAMEWHTEVLYGHTDTPEYATSPSYLATQAPGAGGAIGVVGGTGIPAPVPGFFFVPGTHPAIAGLAAAYPTATTRTDAPAAATGDTAALVSAGLLIAPLTFRPFGWGGNPIYGGPITSQREFEAVRVSTSLTGELGDTMAFDLAATYMEEVSDAHARDTLVGRLQLALLGLGGPDCGSLTPGANGCLFYNPFSTAIAQNAITGVDNPNHDPSQVNSAALADWLAPEYGTEVTQDLLVLDAVLTGDTGLELPGGALQWAAGVQYRQSDRRFRSDDVNDISLNPCAAATMDSGFDPATDDPASLCGASLGAGPFLFLGAATESDVSQDVAAVFAELSVPLLENLEAQVAVRYEDIEDIGSTVDPKLALRWQALDWLALRGSAGTTFRAPPANITSPGLATSLQLIGSSFRSIDTNFNPDLEPESADAFNLGIIVDVAGFYGSVDYWRFEFDNPLGIEPLGGMVSALFTDPDGTGGAADRCGTPALAGLQQRFTFSDANGNGIADDCGIGSVSRVNLNWINGAAIETDGIDISLAKDFELSTSTITTGLQSTYTLGYDIAEQTVEGVVVQPARDAAGLLNYQTSATPIQEWKGQAFFQWSRARTNTRLVLNYIDSYIDQRSGNRVKKTTTWDLHHRFLLNLGEAETSVSLSVENLTDEDPPFAALDLNYDPFTGDALGRVIKVGLNVRL